MTESSPMYLRSKRLLTGTEKKICAARQQWRCEQCSCILPASFQVDHITPLWDGGTNEQHNLQALCGTCHAEKTLLENNERFHHARRTRVPYNNAPQRPLPPPRAPSPLRLPPCPSGTPYGLQTGERSVKRSPYFTPGAPQYEATQLASAFTSKLKLVRG
jgi:hypothetical protein